MTEPPHYSVERVLWEPSSTTGTRAARTPVWLDAYVPASLQSREWRFSAAATVAFGDAQAALERAEAHAQHVGLRTIARQLLRSESMASSQIEGVPIPGHRSLAKSDVGGRHRAGARAALANIDAVEEAYRWAATDEPFTVDELVAIHERLAQADRQIAQYAGKIRTSQNWVGRNPHTPAGADFVPPPPHHVPPLLDDLCAFLGRTDLPPVGQAALAHVQFETIHPFGDGNGRVGRALIGASLIRSRICREVVPPVSLVLARDKDRYVEALTAFRSESGSQHGPDASADPLFILIAEACELAANASIRLADQVAALQDQWRADAQPRVGSAAALIVEALPAEPMLDVDRAAAAIGRSKESARVALNALTDAGVLRPVTVGRRNRIWESVGLFKLVDDMERELSGGAVSAAATATATATDDE